MIICNPFWESVDFRIFLKVGNTEDESKTKIAISSHSARNIAFNAINSHYSKVTMCHNTLEQNWQQNVDVVNDFLSLVVELQPISKLRCQLLR